jgi:nucleoside-diphosphate-sugar epimerase
MRFDLVVNRMSAWAFATGEIPIRGDGSSWRPLVHVEDVARAYAAAVEAPRELIHCRAFNVGSTAENYRMKELASIVSDVTGARMGSVDAASPDPRSYRVDCNAIGRALPQFKPQWTVRRGVEDLVAGFQTAGLTTGDLRGPRFERIRHVRELTQSGDLDRELRWAGTVRIDALPASPRR